ncbi:umta methyltransferase family protein [Ophiostoma piceae UAMH 11346]|uniref:Umta methyltransferase family protein n=1 Tax=Ophiostoma piceae (strain UAMH 11346) TaxID=1262450 RepID=S3CAD1_OPHP1|nr:umta methyltransferase family protein [Ophiostoma piceae UAMH 11346]
MADDPTKSKPEETTSPATASSPPPTTAHIGTPELPDSPGAGQDVVQVDDDRDDDPGYDDGASDASSFVSSLQSSVMQYRYKPNDDDEQERMDLGHHIYRLLIGGELHLAPIGDSPQRVLDLGTGTGIWAMDFADQYPSAQVIGTDLSPIQPRWTPPNCFFEVDDFEESWVYRRQFDYIHARELGGCISDPVKFFAQIYDNLAPGGYFEMQVVFPRFDSDDGTHVQAEDAQFWMKNICEGAGKFGKPLDAAPEWFETAKAAGFVDVQKETRKIPIGAWPRDPTLKEIGRFQMIQEQQVIDSYTPGIFSHVLGWTNEEITVLISKVKKDLTNPAYHLYIPAYFFWGKKP